MTDETPQQLIDSLDKVLDEERKALVQGDLEKINALMTAKETLIEKINGLHTVAHGSLTDVHEKVTRNQALLGSALEGIRAVANRMADLRRVRAGLETYDRSGRKTNYGLQAATKVEKRA
ncbi:flagellar biosynthesis protein FlgN [Sedimentitalea sp. JM2-8]|uniref:Flagellar biosynthesis protein FlgN n=1 Tax=Sedimentitalea xiamensis TaxID=3050037 RepID=A0ABT7F926_9RHOB|nr:flagellar biosynthesis protein FlgN [Sedimentitalea xiamensis]MDK3071612.1 flagellar biosynthesis protein FlgN [Sedimentitalea xiamensis]